jgi:hypothetical protein
MPGLVLSPPTVIEFTGPVVFLAGPIRGAPDWQADAVRLLHSLAPGLHVANPRRVYPPGTFDHAAQVDWETHHLRRAGADGVILFWLADEAAHDCTRAYAQTTRFELAEWKVRHERDGAKLVVGVGDRFTGARYIRRRFAQDCPAVPVVASLDEACRAARAVSQSEG